MSDKNSRDYVLITKELVKITEINPKIFHKVRSE